MSLYVYAIADALVTLDDLRGVVGETLRIVASGDGRSHAIAGDITADISSPPVLTAETLRAQDALVREIAARADGLLPSRFGARFADETALRQTLDELAPRLERALARVRGCEQMTIRLFHDEPLPTEQPTEQPTERPTERSIEHYIEQPTEQAGDVSDARNISGISDVCDDLEVGPGTRYMRARQRAAEGRQLPAAVDMLRAALANAIAHERVERGQSPVIGSIHHLIPRGSAERYRARLDEAAASPRFAASGIRLRVSGPSPAYAFAEADLS